MKPFKSPHVWALALSLSCTAIAGCGTPAGSVASSTKPKAIQASNALGETISCENPNDEAELFIVDLPASRRGDVEIAMKDGLVAVKYDCNSLKILKGCTIPGSYAYKGTLVKEEVVRLENADEIRANLPLSGAGVAADMSAELQQGATLDLAMALVGQQRAARYEVDRSELQGRCDGATHFVQAVYIGAFAMKRGERSKAAAAADVFGFGASGSSSSSGSSEQSDGNLQACRSTKSDATRPNNGCGALLRAYLLPISEGGGDIVKAKLPKTTIAACPKGLTRVGNKCTATEGPTCSDKEPKACETPCNQGNSDACAAYGIAVRYGRSGVEKSRSKAAKIFSRGCELGNAISCTQLSRQYKKGKGVERNDALSAKFAQRACALGSGEGCFYSGLAYMDGDGVPKNEDLGFAAYEQGCAAGDAPSCTNLGKAYSKGKGVKADVARSFKLYIRACEGGSSTGCYNVGVRYSKGKGTVQDPQAALRYFIRGCRMRNTKACLSAAKRTDDPALWKRACELGSGEACQR